MYCYERAGRPEDINEAIRLDKRHWLWQQKEGQTTQCHDITRVSHLLFYFAVLGLSKISYRPLSAFDERSTQDLALKTQMGQINWKFKWYS